MTLPSVTHATFVIERRYAASPPELFRAFADPALKERWFGGGEGWEDISYELDFRLGGSEHSSARQPGGPAHVYDARFLNIVPERRIVSSYVMHLDETPISVSLATVTLEPIADGTRLVYTEQGAFLDGQDKVEQREAGCAWLLDQLGAVLAGPQH